MNRLLLAFCLILVTVIAASFGGLRPQNSSAVNTQPPERARTIPLLPKLNFKGTPEISVHGNFVTLFDRANNRTVLARLDSKADTVRQFWDLKGATFPYKQLLRKTKFNPLIYEELRPRLISNGDADPWILESFSRDSSLCLLIEFILPKVIDEKNNYLAEPVYFIYSRNYFNGHKDLDVIDLKACNDLEQKKYTLHSGKPLFTLGEQVFLTLEDTTVKKQHINQLSQWEKNTAGNYQFKHRDSLAYSGDDYKQLRLDSNKLYVNQRFLFTPNASLVYDYKKKERIAVKTITLFHAAILQDVKEKNGQLLLLVNRKNKLDVMIYDKNLEQIFGQVNFSLPPGTLLSSAKFCRDNSLSVLSADKKYLHLVKLE